MLTQSQIDAFHRDGFLIMPGVIRGRELAALQEASARVVAQGIARQGEDHSYVPVGDQEVYWRSERLWDRDATFRAVTLNPELCENIGQCVGHDFFPWNDSLVVKTPGGGPVTWHQDPPYGFGGGRSETYVVPNFTTDLYLDDSTEENGCVWAIPGHHLVGSIDLASKSQDELFAHPAAVPVRMKAGDVLFHALSTPHGSRANPPAARMRRTFYIHYISQEAHDQAGYRPWSKMWWGEEKRAQMACFAADRAALGWSPAYGPHIRESEEGLRFTGAVTTPRRHWGDLLARIPQARREEMKALKVLAAARG